MAVQGPPLCAIPVSRVFEVGIRILNNLEDWLIMAQSREQLCDHRYLWSAPQPVGASSQLGKEQALHCAENLFSRCGVKLSEEQSYARPSIGVSLPGSGRT